MRSQSMHLAKPRSAGGCAPTDHPLSCPPLGLAPPLLAGSEVFKPHSLPAANFGTRTPRSRSFPEATRGRHVRLPAPRLAHPPRPAGYFLPRSTFPATDQESGPGGRHAPADPAGMLQNSLQRRKSSNPTQLPTSRWRRVGPWAPRPAAEVTHKSGVLGSRTLRKCRVAPGDGGRRGSTRQPGASAPFRGGYPGGPGLR